MAKRILKCNKCKTYTLNKVCDCGSEALDPRPPKYSPDDKYAKYRKEVKKEQLKEEGLL